MNADDENYDGAIRQRVRALLGKDASFHTAIWLE